MKHILLPILLSCTLFSYEKGDTINDAMAAHLNINDEKVYIVDFFASWCSSCKKEIPLISKANTVIDPSKTKIIGIDVDKDPKKGIAFQKMLQENNQLNFQVINDPQNLIITDFNPTGMPTLFYIKNKKVLKVTTGAVPNIDEEIIETLKGMH